MFPTRRSSDLRYAEGCRCPVDQPPRSLQPDLHVGDLVTDRLVLADQLAELLSGARVPHRALEQALHGTDMASPQQRPFPVHRLGEDRGPAPTLPITFSSGT